MYTDINIEVTLNQINVIQVLKSKIKIYRLLKQYKRGADEQTIKIKTKLCNLYILIMPLYTVHGVDKNDYFKNICLKFKNNLL